MAPRRRLPLLGPLAGPSPAWPGPLEAVAERWASLPPRARLLMVAVLVILVALGVHLRVQAAEHRWGGAPVTALVAVESAPVGALAEPVVRAERRPPTTLPPDAVAHVDADAPLALALPEGAVLTRSHLDPSGPAAGLPEGLRAVPVEVSAGWGVEPGAFVDLWGEGEATPLASGRPVLEVRDDAHQPTALVGLAREEVAAVAAAEELRLTHAPAPPEGPAPRSTGPDDE